MARLTDLNMNMMQVISVMGDGNPGACAILMSMLMEEDGILDILLLDSYEIYGNKIYNLNNDCCGRDYYKYKRTLKMIRNGEFSRELIHANLELPYSIPFIDDSVVIEGVPPYGEEFGITHKKWNEYCNAQRESFNERINSIIAKKGK